MHSGWTWAGAVAVAIAALPAGRAEDDVPADPAPAAARQRVARPEIDLATHVDINVVLPPNQWQVSGGPRGLVLGGGRIVVAGGGRLVIGGNVAIDGAPAAEAGERIRRTDEALLARLRQRQAELLAAVAADPRVPAGRRRSLELATEVDIRRVTADVARLRDRYAGRQANLGDDTWREFQADVEASRKSLADPFGTGSLYAAVRAGLEPAAKP